MNLSNLSHPVVQARIYAAMRMAVNAANGLLPSSPKRNVTVASIGDLGLSCIVNKKGKNFLTVVYDKRGLSGFSFSDGTKDVTDVVIQSLRMN